MTFGGAVAAALRTSSLLAAVLGGWAVARWLGVTDVQNSMAYQDFVTAVLGFGLYASTRAIALREFRDELGTVAVAVTAGVLGKAAIVAGVMYLAFQNPAFIVLGIAVAQIDPVSVAAVQKKSKLSTAAKSLLLAWASFDDPVTVLLTTYLTVLVLHPATGVVVLNGDLGSFAAHILWNLLLAGVMWLIWRGFQRVRGHFRSQKAITAVLVVVVLVVAFVAVSQSLLLGLALTGLFFRPALDRFIDGATQVALYVACFALGLVLVGGVRLFEGAILGVAAYVAQVVVGFLVTSPKRWHGDRMRLALSQQNGLTAIVLALLLEPVLPGATAIIAPAILVVYVLHAVCNGLWDRHQRPVVKVPAPVPVSSRYTRTIAKPHVEPAG
ncbi:cation:proton antiporter [Actinocrispum wychmicini]|uniref:Sodium/hydrogen exchanger family protein n=1 Tax=Actinocrispum wychmicini TaxID=1213861 RepID=A0A4R2J5D1_9PSEU|nr:cation:proton antiporter [Actinocrispum wychmicini]TCO53514.1 sodium/hydrogen exchanger family protein [Actinocrispum wychmicini]